MTIEAFLCLGMTPGWRRCCFERMFDFSCACCYCWSWIFSISTFRKSHLQLRHLPHSCTVCKTLGVVDLHYLSQKQPSLWFGFSFIAVSSFSGEVFSYPRSHCFSVSHLTPTEGNEVSARKQSLKNRSAYKHHCYPDVFSFSLCTAQSETAKMEFQKEVEILCRQQLSSSLGLLSGSVSIRYGSGGAVGPRPPAG